MQTFRSSIWETWSERVRSHPGKTAIHLWPSDEIITFSELDEQARHWSEALRGQGLRAGDRVLVRCGNTPATIAVFLACVRLRKVFVPLETKTSREQVGVLADRFDARALITPRGCVTLTPTTGKMSLPPEGTILLKMTSGSTGEPRGVAHSETSLAADCANVCTTMGIQPDDLNLATISLTHSYGFTNLVLPLITQGSAMTLLKDFIPRAVLGAMEKTRVTVFPGVPFMFECINDLPGLMPSLPHLRTCISAGAPLSAAVAESFYERLGHKIHSFYGSSESGGITYDASADREGVGNHVGKPLHNVRVEITDQWGRVRVTSGAVGLGYWPQDRNSETIIKNGTFLTGDYGRFDAQGRLELTGRVGNLINIAGKKVNSVEIENCIREIAGVSNVVVLGAPDPQRQEQIIAFVVGKSSLTQDEILSYCRKTLVDYQLPRRIEFLKELPLTERGKLDRQKLLAFL